MHEQKTRLDTPLALLDWLAGETLFSLVSRQHIFWGYSNAGETASIMFGHRHAGTHHDFPSALDAFATTTRGQLGQPEDLALNHTLLAYYRPFFSASLIADSAEIMSGRSVRHLKFRLGLLTSRFRANHPLKACPLCMKQDVSDVGWAFWHLENQFPGVWMCDKHGEPLFEATVKSTGINRFSWSLPLERELSTAWTHEATDLASLGKLSSMSLELIRQKRNSGWLGGDRVVPVFREALHQNGWLTPQGSLRMEMLIPSYLHWCRQLHGPSELGALPQSAAEAGTQLARILRPWRAGTHPIRVLVVMAWLFEDASSFLCTYDRMHSTIDHFKLSGQVATAAAPLLMSSVDGRKERLTALLGAGLSVTAAAQKVGVEVGTAMAWAAQAGIKASRRPKTLKANLQVALTHDLILGMDKATVARTHGVTVQAVTRFLRTELGLYQVWQKAVFLERRKQARSRWEDAVAAQGHMGTKLLRTLHPAIYAWLYRNDKAWLQEHPSDTLAHPPNTHRVAWGVRDLVLSACVDKAVKKLQAQYSNKPLQLWQIYQVVPQLKPKLGVLDKLPLTKKVIENALRNFDKKEDDLI